MNGEQKTIYFNISYNSFILNINHLTGCSICLVNKIYLFLDTCCLMIISSGGPHSWRTAIINRLFTITLIRQMCVLCSFDLPDLFWSSEKCSSFSWKGFYFQIKYRPYEQNYVASFFFISAFRGVPSLSVIFIVCLWVIVFNIAGRDTRRMTSFSPLRRKNKQRMVVNLFQTGSSK